MKMPKIMFTVLFSLFSCGSLKQKFINPYDHVKKTPYWNQKNTDNNSLKSKVYSEIFGDILNYVREKNKEDGYVEIPAPFKLTKKEKAILDKAFALIPAQLKKQVVPLIKGIFFVENLGSSGYKEFIYDTEGMPLYTYFIFDRKVLKMTANEWCTHKEQSPFILKDGLSVRCTLEKSPTGHGAFLYILMQELGHAIQIGNSVFPLSQEGQQVHEEFKDTEYFNLSWFLNNQNPELKVPLFTNTSCKQLKYYSIQPDCTSNDAFIFYENLEKFNLATPYSAIGPEEDFADAFANYFHVKILKKNFEIVVSLGNQTKTFKPCWGDERCIAKEKIFDKIFGVTR